MAGAAKPAGEEGGWNPRGKIFHETLGWGLQIWWSTSRDAKGRRGDFSRLPTLGRATPHRVFKGLCWSKIPDVNTLFTDLIAVQKPASLQPKGPNEAHSKQLWKISCKSWFPSFTVRSFREFKSIKKLCSDGKLSRKLSKNTSENYHSRSIL